MPQSACAALRRGRLTVCVATRESPMTKIKIRTVLASCLVALLATPPTALAQGTLRVGLAAADIPLTTGQADNGAEGMRFVGYTLYDPLVLPMGATAEKPFEVVAALAESWQSDPA